MFTQQFIDVLFICSSFLGFKFIYNLDTVGTPNLSADRVRAVPYPAVFREGPFKSTAQRTVLF
jgi:hypothetical protein